ncbi:hypothetical protein [Robiginitalea marina]|uniref:Polysaccharide chain length determinant N-terminal domain-containing protein n=1 Tax=Robiginitalea marina TaxID=2954105 RepID=A0ABT1AW40_9FLAO|nr:hypothetical protein [Robiginitalea marina]MCO5724221.1 hypothetical protein [Robiginitalea marina]
MATPGTKPPETSDEIDLGQLFKLIGKGFQKMFRGFLLIYLYFKRNFFWFAGLGVLGVLTGYLVNRLVEPLQKLDVIVTPNLDNRNYLYDVVAELQSNLKAKDTAFLRSQGIPVNSVEGFDLEITDLRTKSTNTPGDSELLELMKDFGNSPAIGDLVREALREKTTKDHRITFYFKDPIAGEAIAGKFMEYFNTNAYYSQLLETQRKNAQERIQRNDSLVKQIDQLINNYTEQMNREQGGTEGRLVLENQEPLNVPSLFELKNQLIRDTEAKRLELDMKQEAITIVSFGKPHKVIKPLALKNIVLFPLLFIGGFLVVSMVRYLNRKSMELIPNK